MNSNSDTFMEQSANNRHSDSQQPSASTKSPLTQAFLKEAITRHLHQTVARNEADARPHDWWVATCYAVRDHLLQRMTESQEEQVQRDDKRVYYFSLEYLMGRLLQTNLDNLAIEVPLAAALKELGQDYEKLRCEEDDPGLGNGGLGRLAACFILSAYSITWRPLPLWGGACIDCPPGLPAHRNAFALDMPLLSDPLSLP